MPEPIHSDAIVRLLEEALTIEERTSTACRVLVPAASADAAATACLSELADIAERHTAAVMSRLNRLGKRKPRASALGAAVAAGGPSEALRVAFRLASEGAITYASLGPVTSRFRDSAISASEGMTGHLARDHMQDYVAAMGRIAGLIQDVTLRELAAGGHECQCTCPACGLGMCVCGIGSRAALNEAWMAARPMPESGVSIPSPRSTSAARLAGIQEGDVVVEADGVELASYPQLQTTIKAHEVDGIVRFLVRRGGATMRFDVARSEDLGDGTLPLDCEAPSGKVFYLDRARDLQKRLRRRSNGNGHAGGGLASLSARETQVLRLLADGATNPMIAQKLGIARPTVARHVGNILVKLDVSNRSEAAGVAAAAGLGSDE